MSTRLQDIVSKKKAVIYNELSPFTPYYVNPPLDTVYDLNKEVLFHKKNIYMLSLSFHKIIINIDNLLAFSNYYSMEVISTVSATDWFQAFVKSGVVVLAGWGTDIGSDMVGNQVEYSKRYKQNLKEKSYVEYLQRITSSTGLIEREPKMGEEEFADILLPKIHRADTIYKEYEHKKLIDNVEALQEEHGFVGSMELFPYLEKHFKSDWNKLNYLYMVFYQSYQEYGAQYYSPAISVGTGRVGLPPLLMKRSGKYGPYYLLSTLYQPNFFYRFLCCNFDSKVVDRFFFANPQKIITIRNGDWSIFLQKYHKCIEQAARVPWIIKTLQENSHITDESVMDEILNETFEYLRNDKDIISAVEFFDQFLGIIVGVCIFKPLTQFFYKELKKKISRYRRAKNKKEFDPFFIKLSQLLEN